LEYFEEVKRKASFYIPPNYLSHVSPEFGPLSLLINKGGDPLGKWGLLDPLRGQLIEESPGGGGRSLQNTGGGKDVHPTPCSHPPLGGEGGADP